MIGCLKEKWPDKARFCPSAVVLSMGLWALNGCGTVNATGSGSAHHASQSSGCSPSQVAVVVNGKTQCMAVHPSSQASDISRSSSFIEQAHYQANAHWPTSTNQAARAYMAAVVRYMNNRGHSLFPKKSPLSFPLEWTVSLMNGGGPSGSPDVLWQLSLPSSYLTWTPTQWQFAFDVLEDQEIRSGFATSNFGILANSQNSLDQSFQLLGSNQNILRLIVANSIPVNSDGITTLIPTWVLVWYDSSSSSPIVLWDEWIAPEPEYPQLVSQSEANIAMLTTDLKTSGQQIWQMLHPTPVPSSSPSVTPSSSNSSAPFPTTPPSSSSTPPSSPSPSSTNLNVTVTPTPLGIQVRWTAATGATPSQGTVLYNVSGSSRSLSATITNGSILPGVAIGDPVSVLSVQCSPSIFGYNMSSAVEYGTVATQLTEIHALIDPANTDLLWIQYDRWLPNQIPDQTLTDYQVEDVTTHVPLSVTAATVNSGQLELTVTIPSGTTVVSGNTIQVTTTTSVVTTSTGEPSVTTVQGVFN